MNRPPPPPPMPCVQNAQIYLDDAIAALQRAKQAWSWTQMTDALRSASDFIDTSRLLLESEPPSTSPSTGDQP